MRPIHHAFFGILAGLFLSAVPATTLASPTIYWGQYATVQSDTDGNGLFTYALTAGTDPLTFIMGGNHTFEFAFYGMQEIYDTPDWESSLSGLPVALRAWTEGLLSTRQQATGRVSWVESTSWVLQTCGALTPAPVGRPHAERPSCRARPVPASARHRPDSAISLARFITGEPPYPVPLGRGLQASGGRTAATGRHGHPQLQAHGQPFPHS
jgi:hypothetical protein